MLFENENLCCAHCGEDNLHHREVQVFARPQEDGPYYRTSLPADGYSIGVPVHAEQGNPSRRRSGVKVLLTCEHCPGVSALTIAQHKGFTILKCEKASVRDYQTPMPSEGINTSCGDDWDPFSE